MSGKINCVIVKDLSRFARNYSDAGSLIDNLGHGDIEKAVSEEKIRQLSRSIMDVLWFSLWNKAE